VFLLELEHTCGVAVRFRGGDTALKYIAEILKLNATSTPGVLHRFAPRASSMHMVRQTMKAVRGSGDWPPKPMVSASSLRLVPNSSPGPRSVVNLKHP